MTSNMSRNPAPQQAVATHTKSGQTELQRKDAAAKDEAAKQGQANEGGSQKRQQHK